MRRTMKAEPQYLRAGFTGRPVAVDRQANTLLGFVVAQEGAFKSEGRGRFDAESLTQIAALGNAARGGLKSRFTHPGLSSDGLGKFLGRARDFTVSTTRAADGQSVRAVRADLHFDPTASNTPNGNLSQYVMDLAESDPDALSSSLVIEPDRFVEDDKGNLVKLDPMDDPEGEEPPLWRPRKLHATDIVDVGDAVDGLLSAEQWSAAMRFDTPVRLGEEFLDRFFADLPRDVVEARCRAYLDRYLTRRYGEPPPSAPTPRLDALAERLKRLNEMCAGRTPAKGVDARSDKV